MYVEMMDRVTERRGKTNTFYLSLLSGLLTLVPVLVEKILLPQSKDKYIVLLILATLGFCLCFIWRSNIDSYKQINFLKFQVIYEIEPNLPFPCYKREWEILEENPRIQYRRLSKIEKYVPLILAIPYLGLFKYLGKINYILASKIVQHFFNVSEEALSVFIGAKFNPFIF